MTIIFFMLNKNNNFQYYFFKIYGFQFESSMDRKEIVISNVTCSEQIQILTLFVSSNFACELSLIII